MGKIYLPLTKIQGDPIYEAMMLQLMYIGMHPVLNKDDFNTSILNTTHIYQSIFPKLISDGVRIDDVDCWIEIDKTLLDDTVLESDGFIDCTKVVETFDEEGEIIGSETQTVTLRDYVNNYHEGETTALILASHREFGTTNRIGGTKSEELYVFLNKFGDATLSNCYVEDTTKASKISEYVINVI